MVLQFKCTCHLLEPFSWAPLVTKHRRTFAASFLSLVMEHPVHCDMAPRVSFLNNSLRASLASSGVNTNVFDRPSLAQRSFHRKSLPSFTMVPLTVGESQDILAGFMANTCKPTRITLLREILERSRSRRDHPVNSKCTGGMKAMPHFKNGLLGLYLWLCWF